MRVKGRCWWREQEEPWQTLACCRELAAALRHVDGGPSAYVNHFPVHQDGSCNGLQHYAALGRDERGAVSVSLEDCERPRDVYTDVAEVVSSIFAAKCEVICSFIHQLPICFGDQADWQTSTHYLTPRG